MVTRLYHGNSAHIIFYTLMISLNTLIVAFVLTESQSNSNLFLTVETFIASVLILDVTIRFMALGVIKYFKSWFNIFDLFVSVSCILALSFFFVANSKGEEVDDIITFTLIGIRYSIPLFRLTGWIYSNNMISARSSSNIRSYSLDDFVDFETYDKVPTTEENDDEIILELVTNQHHHSSKEVESPLSLTTTTAQ